MQIVVDTEQLAGVAAAVRATAAAVEGLDVPGTPELTDVGACDAVRMLLHVVTAQQGDLARCLRGTAVLVETAAADYARAESQAAR